MVLRVSYKFARLPDADLFLFAEKVDTNMTGNPVYPTLPPGATLPDLEKAYGDFDTKLNAPSMGGEMETTAKNLSRQTLLGILRKLAGYVQITASTLEELLSSGFEARSANNARSPLDKPSVRDVKNGASEQLIARLVEALKNCNMYEGRASVDGGTTWLPSVFTGDSRHIIFDGLTPGKAYTIQVRGLGGSTGESDWSDPISHMAM